MRRINRRSNIGIGLLLLFTTMHSLGKVRDYQSTDFYSQLLDAEIKEYLSNIDGEVGVALIDSDGEVMSVNNVVKYPLMSVYKLHQAIALVDKMTAEGIRPDSIVAIERMSLDQDTWSPMLKENDRDIIKLTIEELIKYAVELSDNNASNYMFENLMSVDEVDRYIATIIPREGFELKFTEAEMAQKHALAYNNRTSPESAALLIYKLYQEKESALQLHGNRTILFNSLENCKTGIDRITEPLIDIPGIKIGHKTGSGYSEDGVLAAHNDVAYVQLPYGRVYALAVFVKDFKGNEKEASAIISNISSIVYQRMIAEN